ncbi:hypothetical protein GPJ61_27655 [Brevibacillus formosus]|uniref:hypothetical protein n=1 Tax=Brevibacillus formosus TaxID=54913 RepID=UPI001CA4EA5C|nr:hypothetical protein [Brevibacillus formosus]MBW5471567.1 hypothetical protein [Brevibacillus formosus]
MALKLEQYADTLVRVARIQQKMQSYFLLPLAMQGELQARENGKPTEVAIRRVDKLRSIAAEPGEIDGLRNELRKLQKETRDLEKVQSSSSTGKIRLLNEKLTLTQKLESSINDGDRLRKDLERLQPGGIRSLLNQLFRRKDIMELQTSLLRNDREVSMLRLAAPRPRQVKSIKKTIQSTFAEKTEKELKRDIREMKSELSLYYRAERDRGMIKHYQGLADTKGLAQLKLSFQHMRDYLNGNGITQRDKRVEEARSLRVAEKDTQSKHTLWQAIFRPREIYNKEVTQLKERLSLYEKDVPTKAQAERLQREISQWSKVLTIRQEARALGNPIQPQKQNQVENLRDSLENQRAAPQTENRLYVIEKQRPIVIRVEHEEVDKLHKFNIPFQVKEEQPNSYEVLEGDKTAERQYRGVQIELTSNQLPDVEKLLGRSFATDPEVGTIKYSVLKQEKEKKVIINSVPEEKVALLIEKQAPFAAFQKAHQKFNVYCRKEDLEQIRKILDSPTPNKSNDRQKQLDKQMTR